MATLRIKQLVKEKGMTMAEVAKKLDINPVNLSSAVNGNPTLSTLTKIAEVLNVEVIDLFERDNKASVSGFIRVDKTIYEVSSVADLENILSRVKAK